jgi:DNA repair exonuclease SbcCD ATPase subunit
MVKEKEEMEAKKLHMEEEIRDTMEKLMHLKKESATNQAAATEDLRTAFKAMKDQLTVEQDDLLAGFDKERAEFRKRIQDLQDEVEQLNETLAQEKMERERSREALQEQVDEAHKELENVVDNFRSQLTTSAFKQRVEQDEIDQQSSFSQLLKDSINQQKSFKDFINSLPNLCGYALTQHAHNTNELPSHFTPCHTAPHSTTQHHTALDNIALTQASFWQLAHEEAARRQAGPIVAQALLYFEGRYAVLGQGSEACFREECGAGEVFDDRTGRGGWQQRGGDQGG